MLESGAHFLALPASRLIACLQCSRTLEKVECLGWLRRTAKPQDGATHFIFFYCSHISTVSKCRLAYACNKHNRAELHLEQLGQERLVHRLGNSNHT